MDEDGPNERREREQSPADGDAATAAPANDSAASASSSERETREGQQAVVESDGESETRTDTNTDANPNTDSDSMPGVPDTEPEDSDVPEDVQKYARFTKMDGAQYDRVNEFLRDRTYITAREWAIARLCSDFRTETGVEMTKIGENLPELVPFMTDTYTPQAVNQARSSFEDKVQTAGATFLYGAMCDFFTAEELDDVMYESTEVAKFLLEVEGVDLSVEDELEAEERISSVMREVREASEELREQEDE
ncbi:hypothetical protein C482_01205 [Natrialba chahannaoensis JCM 10990]|uniref:Uncharacterized protein n=1 Tax=Natrialba chahannaoensis JCM 10990 TaxID=1227492 RepID=M0B6E7_9EURY|nr:DUF5806 family protein [Natrialba chahannaoensis]ELZ06395.1 hypothetical protein C482_01205 [Natrialba chahannaoensis JCM 10990]